MTLPKIYLALRSTFPQKFGSERVKAATLLRHGLSDWVIYYAVLKRSVLFREDLKSISMSKGSFLAFLSLAALPVTALSCMDDFT